METMKNENALVVAQPQNMTALQLCGNMSAVNALGKTLSLSGFFGQVSESTATAALVNCFLEGLTPLQYKAKYHTFDNGQTGVKSDFIQREFHRLGGDWEFVKWDGEECDMRFTYKGKTLPFRVTLDEFKRNGVALNRDGKTLKANWFKFPREMLKARCMATAIRAICPEAMDGMYTQEEVADFERVQAAAPVVANVEAVSASPIAETVTPTADGAAASGQAADYGVCPCGSVKGKAWGEIDTEILKKILASKTKIVTPEHRNAIVAELGRRENAEIVNAEIVEG